MSFGISFTFAFALAAVLADSKEEGCCFSIGYGDMMRPCCLGAQPNVTFSSCQVGSRIGGATGFSQGGCPHTAEEAHQAIADEEERGCCFSIGFGDGMRPCCLETTPNVGLSSCSVGSRIGGATGFRQGSCPDSAEDAHQAIQPVLEEESQVSQQHPQGVSQQPMDQGCCFSIGFGAFMRPCCLQALPNEQLASCQVGNRMGGATGFTEGACPTTAEEAHEALQHLQSGSANNPTTNLLKGVGRDAETSALPYALVACVSFAAGSLISVFVMYRRQNRDDQSEFMPLDA
jgi:hypothetical protein